MITIAQAKLIIDSIKRVEKIIHGIENDDIAISVLDEAGRNINLGFDLRTMILAELRPQLKVLRDRIDGELITADNGEE